MKTIKIIFVYLFFGLSFLVRGQQIGNYVANGSFEELYSCTVQPTSMTLRNWSCPDSSKFCAFVYHKCWGSIPYMSVGTQYPKDGNGLIRLQLYSQGGAPNFFRSNIKNRLKTKLTQGKTYCATMHVTMQDECSTAIDGFGLYFGDSAVDTIVYHARLPLTFLTPQVKNPNGNIIGDTANWTAITGTFTANGTEKYLIVSNFKTEANTSVSLTGIPNTPSGFSEYFVDAISCIELDLPAYAGKDTTLYLGDSLFIGRQPDFVIDPGCIWYKFPNMTTPLDTISGIWVKPSVTSTYVVRQVLDCSPLKWDTVIVTISTNYVGLDKLKSLSDNINLFPNPTSGNLSISGFSGTDISTFIISNCLGQNVLNGDIILKNNSIIIETSELKSGLYQIHLKTQYGILTKKFVKTN
jgi:hypothetical protein